MPVVRQADRSLPGSSLRGAQEKEAEVSKIMHYLPSSSRNITRCAKAVDWISGTVISTSLLSRVTCPDCLKPESEMDWWLGYHAARGQLRKLLDKVDENMQPAVVKAYLMEETDDRG